MDKPFDSIEYITQIGQELVASFGRAGLATTPGLIGSAKEESVRKMLQSVLPNGLAVGTGCVIDSLGSVSRQTDVVIYEKDICPLFRLNSDDSVTYFPCEGVVAVGEIKSSLSTKELTNAFAQIASVKRLQRFVRTPGSLSPPLDRLDNPIPFRQYGSRHSIQGVKNQEYNQSEKPKHQIYGFVLAGSLPLLPKTLCEKFVDLEQLNSPKLSPNLIVTLDNNILCPLKVIPGVPDPSIMLSTQEANTVYCVKVQDVSFQFLLSRLHTVYQEGKTVEVAAFDRYFANDGILTLPSTGEVVALRRKKSEHIEFLKQHLRPKEPSAQEE